MRYVFIVCTLLSVFFGGVSSLLVVGPPAIAGSRVGSPPVAWLRENQDTTTGSLTVWTPAEPLDDLEAIFGKIILTNVTGILPGVFAAAERSGALGIVLCDPRSPVAGSYDLAHFKNTETINITVVQIGGDDCQVLKMWLAKFRQVSVTIGGRNIDRNYWLEVRRHPVWFFVQAVFAAFSLFILVLGAYKYYRFVSVFGPEFSVAQICLFWSCLICTIKFFYWCIDPIFLIRGIFSFEVSQALISVTSPMYTASVLCLGLYWRDIFVLRRITTRIRAKPLYLVLVALIFTVETISILTRIVNIVVFAALFGTAAALLFEHICVSVFMIHSAYSLVNLFSQSTTQLAGISPGQKGRIIDNTVKYVGALGLIAIMLAILMVLLLIPQFFWRPWNFYASLSIKEVVYLVATFIQVIAFTPPLGPPSQEDSAAMEPLKEILSTAIAETDVDESNPASQRIMDPSRRSPRLAASISVTDPSTAASGTIPTAAVGESTAAKSSPSPKTPPEERSPKSDLTKRHPDKSKKDKGKDALDSSSESWGFDFAVLTRPFRTSKSPYEQLPPSEFQSVNSTTSSVPPEPEPAEQLNRP